MGIKIVEEIAAVLYTLITYVNTFYWFYQVAFFRFVYMPFSVFMVFIHIRYDPTCVPGGGGGVEYTEFLFVIFFVSLP